MAGDIEELKALAEKLAKEDGGQKARTLSDKMMQAIPRFEATEEVRSQGPIAVNEHAYKIITSWEILNLRAITDMIYRNESAVNTARCVSSNSSVRNLTSPCMKVGQGGNV